MKKTRSLIGKILVAVLLLFVFSAAFVSSGSASVRPAATAVAAPAATVFLTPNRIQGTAGEDINVIAEVSDVTALFGYQIGLIWSNPSVAECTAVTNGSILNKYTSAEIEPIPGAIDNSIGLVEYYTWSLLSTDTPPNITGSGGLAVFSFHMLQTGYSDVHINAFYMIYQNTTTIPCNIVDYFTAVRGGNQYVVKLKGNPMESSAIGGFGAMSVTNTIQTIKGISYTGNMTFEMNGTSDDCGPFAYFNATIPNALMNCTSSSNWVVELDGTSQTGVSVTSGAQNTTISLSTNSDPSFVYSTYASGKVTLTINILSNTIAFVPEFASTFSAILLATLLVLVAFATALFTVRSRSRKLRS